jgi:hypothetical protein
VQGESPLLGVDGHLQRKPKFLLLTKRIFNGSQALQHRALDKVSVTRFDTRLRSMFSPEEILSVSRQLCRRWERHRGQFATYSGGLWHCNKFNTTTRHPGDVSAAWTLAVKSGRDGKDATK